MSRVVLKRKADSGGGREESCEETSQYEAAHVPEH